MSVSLDLKHTHKFINIKDEEKVLEKAMDARKTLHNKTGLGNEYLGWLDLPIEYDKEEFKRIKEAAKKIRENSDVLVVIGIGGSYLGAKAVTNVFKKHFGNNKIEVLFVGNNISSDYIFDLKEYLIDKDFSINVISKSGTTTEPAIAFRIFNEMLESKYGEEAKKRVYATTDKKAGALKKLSNIKKYETFVVPDNVGGRYSVFTAVGLLPIAVMGIDIDKLIKGAADSYKDAIQENSDAFIYAINRYMLYKKGYKVEMLVNYEPCLIYISEWWKQLFGESEGKDKSGIFPASASFSTDLHSLGQYIQDGERFIFETVINVLESKTNIKIKKEDNDLDGLNYLEGRTVDYINKKAYLGTLLAHVEGGVPNIILNIEKMDEYNIGYLLYFFMYSCGISAYMLGVNPFNQPGVEAYKKNMFALLGKKGYEKLKEELEGDNNDIRN